MNSTPSQPTMSMPSGRTSHTTPVTRPVRRHRRRRVHQPVSGSNAPNGPQSCHRYMCPRYSHQLTPSVSLARSVISPVPGSTKYVKCSCERLLALGRLRGALDRDLDEDLVDAASVAGQGQEGHLGIVAGCGERRVDGGLRTDVALRRVVAARVQPALEDVVEHQPGTGERRR